jgi:hypothetical protein
MTKTTGMSLPVGKTCGDCVHVERCSWLISVNPLNETCDWSPPKFQERARARTRTMHVSLSIRGILATWSNRDLEGLLQDVETGRKLTAAEVRQALAAALANGRETLPIGEPCEGFDFGGGGCPGHDAGETDHEIA